jgi:hypothetical protein
MRSPYALQARKGKPCRTHSDPANQRATQERSATRKAIRRYTTHSFSRSAAERPPVLVASPIFTLLLVPLLCRVRCAEAVLLRLPRSRPDAGRPASILASVSVPPPFVVAPTPPPPPAAISRPSARSRVSALVPPHRSSSMAGCSSSRSAEDPPMSQLCWSLQPISMILGHHRQRERSARASSATPGRCDDMGAQYPGHISCLVCRHQKDMAKKRPRRWGSSLGAKAGNAVQ